MKRFTRLAIVSVFCITTVTSLAAADTRDARAARLDSFTGSVATDFSPTQTIGEFKGLAGLKGKVVMLDFFAHWCGPCIASFPSVHALQTEFGPKGLRIVGVTRYQGFYKAEGRAQRDLAPAKELERMKGFITDHKMTWPVAFTDNSVFEAYGCTSIPHAVLIDRTGKIRKIKVGHSPSSVAAFRAEVEKLVAEPVKH